MTGIKSGVVRGFSALLVLGMTLAWFTTAPAQSPARAGADGGLLITLEADSTPVITVLEILAERSGLNIVTSPEVQGIPISIRLSNTPFDEALNLVVRAAGMGYERVGNSILVGSPQRLATQTGLTTRVFELEYAEAEEIQKALEVVHDDLLAYKSGNSLVVKAPQATIEEIQKIITVLDTKPQQVMLQARLLEVNTTKLEQLGLDWSEITSHAAIVTEGNPVSSSTDDIPDNRQYTKFNESNDWYRQMATFKLQIDLLITDGNAKLLANSKVTTMENQPAEIFIGTRVPVVTTLATAQGGGTFQNVQIEYINTGVQLNIVPRVATDGSITVNVTPRVSNIVDFTQDGLPITSERNANSVVRVRDGQTFYLAGLLQETQRETMFKVPLLGDIPILGYLFRHYETETSNTDLIIEITPTIIDDQQ